MDDDADAAAATGSAAMAAPLTVSRPKFPVALPASAPLLPMNPPMAANPGPVAEERVRDRIGDSLAESDALWRERTRLAREEAEQEAVAHAGRVREAAARAARKAEISPLITRAAHRELLGAVDARGLTLVDEEPLRVAYDETLKSGTVRYRMLLNDTGLLGAKAANRIWTGRLTWELVEGDAPVEISDVDPTEGPYPPQEKPKAAPAKPAGKPAKP